VHAELRPGPLRDAALLAPLGNRAPGGFNRRAGVFVGGFPGSILIEGEFLRELLLELRDEVRAASLCAFQSDKQGN
jgi:hypothetical protein